MSLAAVAQAVTPRSMLEVSPAALIIFNAVAGHPFLTAYGPATQEPRVLFMDSAPGSIAASIPDSMLLSAVNSVWRGTERAATPDAHDELYRRAESIGDSAAAFTGAAPDLRVYVDPYSGRLLAVMDASRQNYAWIYYALHTLQFPGLIDHPDIRAATVLSLLAVGFAFSITGIVLSVTRLRREFA
jgi:hypothetical protein